MKKLAIILSMSMTLSGCATGCYEACVLGFGPGNPLFNALADSADKNDPCQTITYSQLTGQRLKTDNHQRPDFCFSNKKQKMDIYDRSGKWIGTVKSNNTR